MDEEPKGLVNNAKCLPTVVCRQAPTKKIRMVLNFGYHKETDSKQKLKEILDKQVVPTEEFDKK